ncbi:MAG: (d)CMP kinase [Chloroflexi bacterium]|nr:(d)CMP kinase [Chloroflexota bacterium]
MSQGPGPATVIAIDGPVAAGKTTIGSAVAQRLGYRFLDTGSMYRALTWLALQRGISPEDGAALGRLAAETTMAPPATGAPGKVALVVNGAPLGPELRSAGVERAVSAVSRHPQVRQALVARQREIARGGRLVMVGRDIGTVVMPDAPLKVYLDASPQERARRRQREQAQQGEPADPSSVLEELARRDRLDSQRSLSPLQPAPDARVIDTQGLTPEEVVEQVLKLLGRVEV